MSIWHDDKVFPEDKRYWLAFINVRSNGNKFWKVSHYLADFIEDVSGAGFRVCNTKIEKWCYLDDLFAQQAEIKRLKTTLKSLKGLLLDPDCVSDRGDIYVMLRAIDKALNGESKKN